MFLLYCDKRKYDSKNLFRNQTLKYRVTQIDLYPCIQNTNKRLYHAHTVLLGPPDMDMMLVHI